jgi:hypothetical protein
MFIGGLNWETTDRKKLPQRHESTAHLLERSSSNAGVMLTHRQSPCTTISLSSAKYKNAPSCETAPPAALEASAF